MIKRKLSVIADKNSHFMAKHSCKTPLGNGSDCTYKKCHNSRTG